MDMRLIHKCGTCKTKDKESVRVVIDHVCVMASCELSAVCSDRKCDGSGMLADNMVDQRSCDMRHHNLKSKKKTYLRQQKRPR